MKTDRKIIAMAVICALLIAAFASVVPAHAGSSIDQVDIIDLTAPVIGWEPEYTWKFDAASAGCEPAMPGAGAIWYESQDGENYDPMLTNYEDPADRPVFREGWYYKFVTMVQCDDSHAFSPSVKATVNGVPADFKVSGDTMRITASFGPLEYVKLVTYVNIQDVKLPQDGAPQSYIFKADPNSHAKIFAVGPAGRWYESSDGGFTFDEMPTDGDDVRNFTKGHVYMLKLMVVAEEGYELAGFVNAGINGTVNAFTDTRYFNNHDLGRYCEICAFFPLPEEGALQITTADFSGMFDTYYAGKPVEAEVTALNADADVNFEWFYCSCDGTRTSEKFADGNKASLAPLTSDDMLTFHYVLVTAEEQGTGRKAARVIPYTLYPAGFEDPDPTEEPAVTPDPGAATEPGATDAPVDGGTTAAPASAESGRTRGLTLNTGTIIMLAVILLLLCSTGLLTGILISKRHK